MSPNRGYPAIVRRADGHAEKVRYRLARVSGTWEPVDFRTADGSPLFLAAGDELSITRPPAHLGHPAKVTFL